MRTFTIEVGRQLFCDAVRDYLESKKLAGSRISYVETAGVSTRDFTVRGDDVDVMNMEREIDYWLFQQMNHAKAA
jgi:hypothetical protein